MTRTPPRDPGRDDENELAAFQAAARVSPPSPFDTARAGRDLEAALDQDALQARRWTLPRVAAVAAVAACMGAAVVALAPSQPSTSTAAAPAAPRAPAAAIAPAPAPAPSPTGVRDEAGEHVVAMAPDAVASAPLSASSSETLGAPPGVSAAARRQRTWRDEAERLVEKGDGEGAARVLVGALATDDGAASALTLVARRFPTSIDAVDADLARIDRAEAMRLRCELRLLRVRDARAVDACRAFAQEHPQHPGARTLSYAAGRVAEDLGDLALAEEEYSRALLLSPFVGLPSTDALLSRSRVRAARGDVEEARADLRLYLHNEPGAAADPTVRALADRLKLAVP